MSNILIKQGYVGIFLFVILNFISMVIYPGGTIIEPETKGYSFFYNFLSNLGESTAKNGEDNIVSSLIEEAIKSCSMIQFKLKDESSNLQVFSN